jgi:dienelactone hydrolase
MKKYLVFISSLLLSLAINAAPQVLDIAWIDSARSRSLPLKVLVPEGEARVPVVIFSHGLGGSREGGKAWGEHWAANGYLVIHLQHPGSDEALWTGSSDAAPKQRLLRGATAEQLLNRVQDVRFVLDELGRLQSLPTNGDWQRRADLSRIAMTGHSFGAVTTMALADMRFPGPIRSVADARITAFIAFSPAVQGTKATWPERYGAMSKPFLTITGTIDGDVLGTGNAASNRALLFDVQAPGDKYRVVFEGGDHAVFNGGNQREAQWMDWATGQRNESTPAATVAVIQDKVKQLTLRYLDAYLKDDAAAKAWLISGKDKPGATSYLGDAGKWDHK